MWFSKEGRCCLTKPPALQIATHMPIYSHSPFLTISYSLDPTSETQFNAHSCSRTLFGPTQTTRRMIQKKSRVLSSFPTSTITAPILSKQVGKKRQGLHLASVVESPSSIMVALSDYIVS